MKKKCLTCNKEFIVYPFRAKIAKYCSFKCYWKSLVGKPSKKKNGKYKNCLICNKKFYENKSNPRKYCSPKCFHIARKNKPSWNKGKNLIGIFSDEKIGTWKGNKVKDKALHEWIKRRLEKPEVCQICRKSEPKQLSNISHLYKRDIKDFQWLCIPCHKKYDLDWIKKYA